MKLAINTDISRAIDFVRALSILSVVFIHARTGLVFESPLAEFFADALSRGIGALAVPAFFILSGYLFGRHELTFLSGMRRLANFLGIYIFWNAVVAGLVFLLLAVGVSPGPFLGGKFDGGIISVLGFDSLYPIAYQFWFIRELFLFTAFSIFIRLFVVQRIPIVFFHLVALCIICFVFGERTVVSSGAYIFGFLIAFLNFRAGFEVEHPVKFRVAFLVCLTIAGCVLFVMLLKPALVLMPIFLVFGLFAFFSGSYLLALTVRFRKSGQALAASSFFVFAAHEPLLAAIKRLFHFLPAEAVYIIAPLLVVIFLLCIFFSLPKFVCMKFWFVFLGSPKRIASVGI